MKKIILILSFTVLMLSSCSRRYTCPTYLQNTDEQEDIRGAAPSLEEEAIKEEIRG